MIEIIPAIDLIDGKCVRLSQGDFSKKKIYDENPLEVAKRFEQAGLRRLHLVDLDGAKSGKPVHFGTLEQIAKNTSLLVDFGGGLKTEGDLQNAFSAGAFQVSLGSIAVTEKEKVFEWIEKYGSDKILLGADVRKGKIAINGWQTRTEIEVIKFLEEFCTRGLKQAFVTDISKDGMLEGVSVELYRKILRRLPRLELIASGGVSCMDDIFLLEKIGCRGVIVGKAIYEGKISLEQIERCLQNG
ncbi:MAG: 1-(5-phosphoribosyl)-5-[(5-phosphoribosylamino)methylideneamino]imidazole-4-carboxamide isomerase [Acidobacteria bacterium]|jgi:phosphoribosylformimino-5-aminoimidazole carboxamide ribotide isomerase|nr:MAG: 1-(5-phosphoribosyl)-5-[(5-phosphoribosylamino)methylideneamino]imidazole-4-carboxamide isomerase [Acidobacteriota bacterium]GIU83100.1 MAG: 1-(5-phosphoribosyl)-5-[(5-phosphoribosylamino) methylideneamino] imidazole-4-carboxamide isomerase [Pyrinomonadaceae bacterium]